LSSSEIKGDKKRGKGARGEERGEKGERRVERGRRKEGERINKAYQDKPHQG
jgi:hypothetical protein